MYPELKNSGVIVTNTSGISSVPIAEHTMGLILAMARNFPDSLRYQDQAKWSQQDLWDKPQQISEINGGVLLIVGYGSIGQRTGAASAGVRYAGVGSDAVGKRRHTHAEKILPISQLHEALPHADYVVIAAPETPETKHLIGAEQIARMKRGARLINVARGSLLDEAALIDALQSGALGGAALDVTSKEPLPPESPLWHAPNLFITPHTSAISERLWQRETELLMKLLDEWFSGKELSNRVDFSPWLLTFGKNPLRCSLQCDLIHAFGCDVPFAGVHLVFLFFAFLVLHRERRAVRRDQFYFYFAEFSVAIAVGRAVGQAVLIAQKCRDLLKNSRNFAFESREPGIAAGFMRESLHLIFVLHEIDFASASGHAIPR